GCSVAVIDRGAPPRHLAESLPPNANPLLDRLGLDLQADGHLRCVGNRIAWEEGALWERDFLFDRFGCGWLIDRERFDARLRSLAEAAGVRWLSETVHGARQAGERVELLGLGLTPWFVVDASGRSATVVRGVGGRRQHGERPLAEAATVPSAETDCHT